MCAIQGPNLYDLSST